MQIHTLESIFDIPLSYLIQNINDKFSAIPRITFARTLSSKWSMDTIGDVIKATHIGSKPYKEFVDGISANIDLIHDTFHGAETDCTETAASPVERIYDIPADFIYLHIDDEFECVTGATYIKTLKEQGCISIRDIFNGGYKSCKRLLDLQKGIRSHVDLIYDVYRSGMYDLETGKKIVTIPEHYSPEDEFHASVRTFAAELFSHINSKGEGKSGPKKDFARAIQEVYIYSPAHPDPSTINDLAALMHCTRQNVEFKLDRFKEGIRSMYEGGFYQTSRELIKADTRLLEAIHAFADEIGDTVSINTMIRKSGIDDGKTLNFLCDILGMSRASENSKIPCVTTGSITFFNRNVGKILKFFRDEVIHIRYDVEFRKFLNKSFKDSPEDMQMLDSFVCNSDEFNWREEEGEKVVSLRWDLLEFIPAEVCWILFENDAVDFDSALSDSDLVRLYNIKARSYGIKDISEAQLTHSVTNCWRVMNIGKTGYWKLRSTRKETFDLDTYVRDYIMKVSSEDMDGFLAKAEEDGLMRIYKTSGLRTAYTRNGGHSVTKNKTPRLHVRRRSEDERQEVLDAAKDILRANGNSMQMSDLVTEIMKVYEDLNVTTFQCYIKAASDTFDIMKRSGNRSSIVTLKGHDHIVPVTFHDKIRKYAITDILVSETGAVERSVLYDRYAGLVPPVLNTPAALSKIFGDQNVFEKSTDADGKVYIRLTKSVVAAEKVNMREAIDRDMEMKKYLKLLQDSPSYEWSALKTRLNAEFKGFFSASVTDLPKVLDNMYYIMSIRNVISEDSTFHESLSALPGYFAGILAKDREYALKQNLTINIEPFIRNYYQKKYGSSIADDIYREWDIPEYKQGLATYCSFLESECGVLPYKEEYGYGTYKGKVKEIVKRLIAARNHNVGHPDTLQDKSPAAIRQRVSDVLTLFIYLSSRI